MLRAATALHRRKRCNIFGSRAWRSAPFFRFPGQACYHLPCRCFVPSLLFFNHLLNYCSQWMSAQMFGIFSTFLRPRGASLSARPFRCLLFCARPLIRQNNVRNKNARIQNRACGANNHVNSWTDAVPLPLCYRWASQRIKSKWPNHFLLAPQPKKRNCKYFIAIPRDLIWINSITIAALKRNKRILARQMFANGFCLAMGRVS